MGRRRLERSESLRRVLEQYPELAILPPAEHRECSKCWFKESSEKCPFGEDGDVNLQGCIERVRAWNESILKNFAYMYDSGQLVAYGMSRWKVRYWNNDETTVVEVSAKNVSLAAVEVLKMFPDAVVLGVECIVG